MRSIALRLAFISFFACSAASVIFAQADDVAASTPTTGQTSESEQATKIPGLEIARPGGGFLGVRTEGVTLRVTFYDKDKKKIPADAARITARWRDGRPRFAVLLPSEPATMSSPGVFQRPFNYIVYLAVVGPDDSVLETHSLTLAGSDKE
ncbi:MAG: hypothetical protein MUE42_04150 [Opitutaceae bacterium]|nr:hypothetical protein [Opitutaceae bacterium]